MESHLRGYGPAGFFYAPLVAAAISDAGINVIGWIVSSSMKSDMLYDILGATAHLVAVLLSFLTSTQRSWRNLIATILVATWAVRLGSFLFTRIIATGGDKRLEKFVQHPLKFAIPWFMQTLWVLFNLLPLIFINCESTSVALGVWDVCAIGAWVAGFLIEHAADEQKRAFRAIRGNKGRFIHTGIWAYSRHPNYFGEIVMWVAMAALCAPPLLKVGGKAPLVLLSPLFIVWLLTCVSGIPLLEAAGEKKWGTDPAWRRYVSSTNVLVPWFPSGGAKAFASLPRQKDVTE